MDIKVLQINVRHSLLPAASLSQLVLDFNIDLILLQEPYVHTLISGPVHKPTGYICYHMLAHDHAYGAAIIARTSLGCKLIPELPSNAAVCVEFADIQLFSAYCKPTLDGLETILGPILGNRRFQHTRAVTGMDADARNPLWNSTFTDDKGRELELRPIAISSTRSPECACCRACLGPSRNQFYRFYSCRG